MLYRKKQGPSRAYQKDNHAETVKVLTNVTASADGSFNSEMRYTAPAPAVWGSARCVIAME
jgi:hypothetical protein